jgi:hypothetical protein
MREKKHKSFTVGKSEGEGATVASQARERKREWAYLPHKHATRRRGGNGPICLSSTRPDAGRFIAGGIHMKHVLYGMTGEPKGEGERDERGERVGNVLYTA